MPFIIIDPPAPFATASEWRRFDRLMREHIGKLPAGERPAALAELEKILRRRPSEDLWGGA